jgi:putative oxidoreductase
MKKQIVVDIISCLFILLFLYTGLMKIFDHDVFVNALDRSTILHDYASVISVAVPFAELLIVASLVVPKTRQIGLYGSFILMALFTIYVGYMLYFRTDRYCSCGGIIRYLNWHQHFYFNTGFTILGLLAIWLDKKIRLQVKQQYVNTAIA